MFITSRAVVTILFWLFVIVGIICLLNIFAQHAHGQPSSVRQYPPATEALTPQAVQQSFSAWMAVAAFAGGTIWHMILKVAPWAKANGGLFKGVVKFFWDFDNPVPAPKPPINTAPVELSPTSMR